MLQNSRVAAFTISELLRENQQGGGGKIAPYPPPRLGLKEIQQSSLTKDQVNKNILNKTSILKKIKKNLVSFESSFWTRY